ncbi:hypothetical protein LSM04_004681 [Trypanosoma melophagium]|uniref:uncharacterized protein n=1 Tax=Trypanosoma melophagium TaxID=715481 RepID=UPI00351A93C3|nr:hypothetical protein LSM04_004681 [Trypanosoma melophagium]
MGELPFHVGRRVPAMAAATPPTLALEGARANERFLERSPRHHLRMAPPAPPLKERGPALRKQWLEEHFARRCYAPLDALMVLRCESSALYVCAFFFMGRVGRRGSFGQRYQMYCFPEEHPSRRFTCVYVYEKEKKLKRNMMR